MADKSFGVKELNLLNASGTPTVTSPNNLNLNANTVAISTSATVGNNLTVTSTTTSANVNVTGIATVVNFNATGISTIAVPSNTNANSALLVTANGSSAYRFTGPGQDGSDDNPNIYLVRGQRYIFTNNSGGSHPFQIRVANGGAAYSTGVTNNGASSGNIIFNVQHDAPAQLYYQCTNHGGMVGNIYVVGGPQVISGVVTATSLTIDDYIYHQGDTNTFIGFESDETIRFNTNGSDKLKINSSGHLILADDNNTYIHHPAGDSLAVTTGGSERLRINSVGAVMVGGTLQAGSNGGLNAEVTSSGAETVPLSLINQGTADDSGVIISHRGKDDAGNQEDYNYIKMVADDTGSGSEDGSIRFWTAGGGTLGERVRITSGGNLLVGTTSGSGKLHVEDSGEILAYIVGNTSSAGSRLVLQNKNTTANCYTGVEGADAGGQTTASILFYNANNSTNEGFLTLQTRPANGLPTERLRIDSSGRLLIGTTTEGHASADDFTVASSANTGITIRSGTSSEGNIYFSKGTSGSDEYKGIVMYNHNGNAMQFYTDTAERLRINSSGKLLVGRTSSITITGDGSSHVFEQLDDNGYAVGLHCDQSNQRGLGIYYNTSRTPADAIRFVVGGSAKFIVLGSGNVTNANNSYGNISDVSLKENIVDAGSQWNDIKNIKIRNYNFKESTGQETHKQIGVVAQELETVCPKLVSTDQDGMKNVASSVLYMKAVKALQEAQTRIETLEAEVAALKGS